MLAAINAITMTRKLILTPYEIGYLAGLDKVFKTIITKEGMEPVDLTHLLLSAVSMAGVDRIYSIGQPTNTDTTLIKKVAPKASSEKWVKCYQKVDTIFKNYAPKFVDKETNSEITDLAHIVSHLLYAMETNSAALFIGGIRISEKANNIPSELLMPIQGLISSIQTKSAQLPLVKGELERKDVNRLLDVLQSKEFASYKEAQMEIELSPRLTEKTIRQIEKAGKDLLVNNTKLLFIKDNVIKAISLSNKVIDLFFGKLPGILSEYAGTIVTDYLKGSKTIPIYTCEAIIREELHKRVAQYLLLHKNNLLEK